MKIFDKYVKGQLNCTHMKFDEFVQCANRVFWSQHGEIWNLNRIATFYSFRRF